MLNMMDEAKASVLVIDDEPGIRDVLEMDLELEGYAVKTAESASMAFRALKDHRFDIVLTDIRMPETDGFEVLRKMKEFDNDLEVIVLSGYISEEAEIACLKNGAFECVRKPYKSEVLNMHLERALKRSYLQGLAGLNEASRKLMSTLHQPDLIRVVLELGHKLFVAEPILLMLRGANGGDFDRHAFEMSPGVSDDFARALARRAENARRPELLSSELASDAEWAGFGEAAKISAAILCPLLVGNRSLGSLLILRRLDEPPFLVAEFRRAVNFAAHAALALENARLYQVVEEMAVRDELTGLFSRRYLHESLNHQIRRLRRNPGASVACLFVDLDHFKEVNDRVGHAEGDALLCATADAIKSAVRQSDVVARVGGDEFVVVLPDTNELGATVVGEKIRQSIESSAAADGTAQAGARVTASVGVVALSVKGFAQETEVSGLSANLIESADKAMYRAKQCGRNRVSK
ncbi:MAG: diguanylate cyclase [Deltaproteobacteria bacterium]|nr:diguanylate cyclase [Deltaproteobacteria bacterium]